MKHNRLKYILVFLVLACNLTFGQSKYVMVLRSAPSFTLQFNLNYNQSYLDFNGTYNNDFHSDNFMKGQILGADKGYGAALTSKIPLTSKGKLRLNISLNYNRLQTYLWGANDQLADVGKTKYNMISAGIGLEHNFTAHHKFKIYLGGEALGTIISGSGTVWVENRGAQAYTYDVKITNSFRIGASVFGGTEYMLNNRVGLSLGFKYNFINLFLKDAKQTDDPNASSFPLRDKFDPNVRYSGDKTLAYISIMGGVNLYWGITEKRYVINR